jgi:hypothetical protein
MLLSPSSKILGDDTTTSLAAAAGLSEYKSEYVCEMMEFVMSKRFLR